MGDTPDSKPEPTKRPIPANPKQLFGDLKLPVHLVPPALVLEA